MSDDWEKLTTAEQHKVRDLSCTDWEDVEVFTHPVDTREGKFYNKSQYGVLVIKFKRNGKQFQTTISAQPSGYRYRAQKSKPWEKDANHILE